MHVYIYETNILVDFVLNKNDGGRKKNNNTGETSWMRRPRPQACCTYEKEKRRNIEQQRTVYSTVYRTIFSTATEQSVQPTDQSTVQHTEQSTAQSTVQPSAQSNGFYVYGVGILAVLAIGVCVIFAYNTSQAGNKKLANEKQPPKRRHML